MIDVATDPCDLLRPPVFEDIILVQVDIADDDDVGAFPAQTAVGCDLQPGAGPVRPSAARHQCRVNWAGQRLVVCPRVSEDFVKTEGGHRPAFRQAQDRNT